MAGEALNANYLIIVSMFLACMLLAVIGAKMFKSRLTPGMQTGRQMAMKEHLMLGSHEKVCLIEVNGKSYMVGMVRQQPMCIVPIEGAADADAVVNSPAPAGDDQSAHAHKADFDRVLGAGAADDDEDELLLIHQARSPAKRDPAKPPQKNILKNAQQENRQEPQPPKPGKTNKKGEHSAILSAMRQARRANPKLGF